MKISKTLVLAFLLAPAPAFAADARVLLDRLTWCRDGQHLALEALYQGPDGSVTDTLLVDLSQGAVSTRSARPLQMAFDDAGGRMATAGRYTILYGPSAHPDSAVVLSTLNPVSAAVDRIGFSSGGDSVLVLTHPAGAPWYEISGYALKNGRQRLLARVTTRTLAETLWTARGARGEASSVTPVPFSDFYLPVRGSLFYLERSETGPGTTAAWVYDLHRRDGTGGEKIMTRNVTPWAYVVSPDSEWVAFAASVTRADYGGRSLPSLVILSTDGVTFYTVVPEGIRTDSPVNVRSMRWHRGLLWYLAGDGLYTVDPKLGRSRLVALGAGPLAGSDTLSAPARVYTLIFPETYTDTTAAVLVRERLRRSGWPAWVAGSGQGPWRVAVGGDSDTDALERLAVDLSQHGLETFSIDSLDAAGSGLSFPHARVRSPDGSREAYLSEIGPPGFSAGELWISEQRGARQVRLIRAMLRKD